MKSYFSILVIFLILITINACTPTEVVQQEIKVKPIYGTGDDSSVHPDNEKD